MDNQNNSNNTDTPAVEPPTVSASQTPELTNNAISESPSTPTTTNSDISSEEITSLKNETIEYAKKYAMSGMSTRKEPSPSLANDQGPYTWWEKQATYEGNTWSISLWEYDNKNWQLQATKVELQIDGHSRMTAYSMRKDSDTSFPGFQIYREQKDDRYHKAAVEDIVYINRVLKGLVDSIK